MALALSAPLALTGAVATASPARPSSPSAAAHWTTQTVAPGVQIRTGTLTDGAAAPRWAVTVQAPVTAAFTGAPAWAEVGSPAWAATTAERVRVAGFTPQTAEIRWPRYTDTPHGLMGVRLRAGAYPTRQAAQEAAARLTAAGLHTAVEWTGYDADQPADIEHVHVAVIDPRSFRGSIEGTHDVQVTQRETVSSVAGKLGSLVGVNGGFFITSDADAVQGVPAGLAVYGGRVESLAVGARAALLLQDGGRRIRIADLTTTATARAGDAGYPVHGVNRTPGLVRNCGQPGALPTERPRQDLTCTERDDLVAFTPAYGRPLPTGAGSQVVLDAQGRVVSAGERGGSVAAGGQVLQGIGAAADWLAEHAVVGRRVSVGTVIRDGSGRPVALGPRDSIVSAAPTLVRDGRIHVDAATEGTVDPSDLSFGYAWSNNRQPRTMAGVDGRGRLLLVTVDGRQAGGSEGFTLAEGAAFMRSLGALQALNLDGGGSSAMAVGGTLVNHPSDAAGERAVGDTVQVLPPHS
jgi:exopolysaccharide biosynthesis protein